MSRNISLVAALLALPGFGLGAVFARSSSPAPPKVTLPPLTPDFKLVWSDDFTHDPDGFPDPSRWSFEQGYVRNNERQYYTANRAENCRIENGHLVFEIRKESYTPGDGITTAYGKSWKAKTVGTADYTSASITTVGKESWQYGRIEIRAKMPKGDILWPALWTLGDDIKTIGWPRSGEIDLLEMLGTNIVSGNFHYAINGIHVSSDKGILVLPTASTQFHTYTIDWTADRINLYADGVRFSSFDVKKADEKGQNPYHQPHFLIMNVALHGGPIDDSIFPQQMLVDYVKVYQKSSP